MKKILSIIAAVVLCSATLSAQTLDRSIQPKAAKAGEIKIKDAQTFTLENGLKVFVVEDHKLPKVYYSIQFDYDDPLFGEKTGLDEIFSQVAGTATNKLTKSELNKAFDLLGARFNFSDKGAYVSGLTKYSEKFIELFTDVVLNAKFTQTELNLAKTKLKSGLAYISSDAGEMMKIVSATLMFGKNTPKGEMFTEKTIDSISIGDVEKFYKTYIAPNCARLAIVGDITLTEAKKEIEKYFGKWEKREVPAFKYEIPQAPQANKVALVNKTGAPQSVVNVCYPIVIKPYQQDDIASNIANYILGGGASGRLFQDLREKHGYTYGCYSSLEKDDVVGSFSASASVRAEVTDSAITQIIYEMNKMVDTAITEKELADAKAYMSGNFGRSLQNAATVAKFSIAIEKYKLPEDYFKNYLKRLEAITIDDVKNAAKKYICPQNAWIIVVGDKSHAKSIEKFAADGKVDICDMYGNAEKTAKTESAFDSTFYILAALVIVLGVLFFVMKRKSKRTEK